MRPRTNAGVRRGDDPATRVVMVVGRSTGGIGVHVRDLVGRLIETDLQIAVVTDDITQERFRMPRACTWWPHAARPRESWRDLRSLRALVRGADVVHAHGYQAGALAVAATSGLRSRPAVVVSLHNELVPGGLRGRVGGALARWTARRAALVTGASDDLVAVARDLGARRAELAEVPSPLVTRLLATDRNGWRAEHRRALLEESGVDPARPVVLTISRVAPQKRLDVLVDAAAGARSSEGAGTPSWVVVGDGVPELRQQLTARIRDEGVDVHLVGAVPDPVPWLLAADVFVLTSIWEARALVVQEAMAAGLPVVVPAVGGLPGLVEDAGVVVPGGDAVAVRAAVDRLLADPAAAQGQAVRGRAVARRWLTPQESARRWRQVYAALVR